MEMVKYTKIGFLCADGKTRYLSTIDNTKDYVKMERISKKEINDFLDLCDDFVITQRKEEIKDRYVNNKRLDILFRFISSNYYKLKKNKLSR
jgi:hypothetical protein